MITVNLKDIDLKQVEISIERFHKEMFIWLLYCTGWRTDRYTNNRQSICGSWHTDG